MDLLLLFAGRSYSSIDSFPFRLRLHASVLSLLAGLVKDQFFPFWVLSVCTSQISTPSFFGVWSSVLLKYQLLPFWGLVVCTSQISTPSFLGFGRLYFSNINSFLFGVCPSVLRQISTSSFLGRLYLLGCQRCAGTKPSRLGHHVGTPLSGPGWSRPASSCWAEYYSTIH